MGSSVIVNNGRVVMRDDDASEEGINHQQTKFNRIQELQTVTSRKDNTFLLSYLSQRRTNFIDNISFTLLTLNLYSFGFLPLSFVAANAREFGIGGVRKLRILGTIPVFGRGSLP